MLGAIFQKAIAIFMHPVNLIWAPLETLTPKVPSVEFGRGGGAGTAATLKQYA